MEKKIFKSLQEVADAYNTTENTMALEDAITESGFTSDMHTEFGVCHDAKEKVVINDNGDAIVVPRIVSKPEVFRVELLDGGEVSSSMQLHKFDYIDGDCICRYVQDGTEYTIRRSEGDLWDMETCDWVHWEE